MVFAFNGMGALDYAPCHYAGCRVAFRGPARPTTGPYIACLGGTETYGRFVPRPFPDLLEAELRIPVVNLGCANAGPDVFVADTALRDLAAGARGLVLQASGIGNVSNAFYSVHPRRNDRFLGATPPLRALYPEVDFTDYAFTRHLLHGLAQVSATRFLQVEEELRRSWLAQMRELVMLAPGRVILLAMAGPAGKAGPQVDDALVAGLQPHCRAVLRHEILPDDAMLEGMVCSQLDLPAARLLPGPAQHRQIASALLPLIRRTICT